MAERFPSIEDFSAGQTEARGESNLDLALDPTTSNDVDFLAREKAALGDDADLFATPHDHLPKAPGTVQDHNDEDDNDEDDLLGGGGSMDDGDGFDGKGMSDFQTSFPAIDTDNAVGHHSPRCTSPMKLKHSGTKTQQVGPGGTITGNNQPFLTNPPSTSTHAAAAQGDHDNEEPEVIRYVASRPVPPRPLFTQPPTSSLPHRQWRDQRSQALQRRDEMSQKRKEETIKAAQSAIDDFYENYNTKKEKTIGQTRKEAEEFLASRQDTSSGGTSWERIAKLVDLSGKGARGGASGTGKERFRELLAGLKKDEKAPGASGY
ncbi:MAG: hypothetical protein M1816_002716 [Peltula sp. TS41687]|nr:MAG: hypothetical protein M1816_002716 [Peltula sp. TS41687]